MISYGSIEPFSRIMYVNSPIKPDDKRFSKALASDTNIQFTACKEAYGVNGKRELSKHLETLEGRKFRVIALRGHGCPNAFDIGGGNRMFLPKDYDPNLDQDYEISSENIDEPFFENLSSIFEKVEGASSILFLASCQVEPKRSLKAPNKHSLARRISRMPCMKDTLVMAPIVMLGAEACSLTGELKQTFRCSDRASEVAASGGHPGREFRVWHQNRSLNSDQITEKSGVKNLDTFFDITMSNWELRS